MRRLVAIMAAATAALILSPLLPAAAATGTFIDERGETNARSDIRRYVVRHSRVDNRLSVRIKLSRVILGTELTVFLDSRHHNPGPEWAMTAYPDSEWVIKRVSGWDDNGETVSCSGSVKYTESTRPVARWRTHRKCLDLGRYVRVAIRVHDFGHGVDWAPRRRHFSQQRISAGPDAAPTVANLIN